ncbi:hypothetical protein [Mycolicibacterium sarraceniae]|nr:hypothetical protein [Mycolicibacterium sarraceniae]
MGAYVTADDVYLWVDGIFLHHGAGVAGVVGDAALALFVKYG